MAGALYALDFDGVIVNSEPESSRSGVLAAAAVWRGSALQEAVHKQPGWLTAALRDARPVVHTGYENAILARLFVEAGATGAETLLDNILTDWPSLRDAAMQQWDASETQLVDAFANVRDIWIRENEAHWLSCNHFYPGVADALNFASAPLFIITTKQKRFVELLLARHAVTTVPPHRIYAYGSGSKISTLKKIVAMPEAQRCTVHFVEDRFDTIEKASLSLLGLPLRMYLATWGYNTHKERDEAAKHPFIEPLQLTDFVTKLQ